MTAAKQDPKTQAKRLAEGRCPVHGHDLLQEHVFVDRRALYACPRKGCGFKHLAPFRQWARWENIVKLVYERK